jgi:hypothetical protein
MLLFLFGIYVKHRYKFMANKSMTQTLKLYRDIVACQYYYMNSGKYNQWHI